MRTNVRMPKNVPLMPMTSQYQLPRTNDETSSRNCVGPGSCAPKSAKMSPKTGTTRTMRNVVIAIAMKMTITG